MTEPGKLITAELETSNHRPSSCANSATQAPCPCSFPARSVFRFTRRASCGGVIRALLSQRLGVPPSPRTIKLAAGAPVQVDAASDDGKVLSEIFAHQGPLKGGQQRKVAIDTLKLITVHREHPRSGCSSASPTVRPPPTPPAAAGWPRRCGLGGVHVEIVDNPADLRAEILAAQAGQTMVNPA